MTAAIPVPVLRFSTLVLLAATFALKHAATARAFTITPCYTADAALAVANTAWSTFRPTQLRRPLRQRTPPLCSASLEEGEDLLYYGVTSTTSGKEKNQQLPPTGNTVQRVYETWQWTYCTNTLVENTKDTATATPAANHAAQPQPQTFQINYRVEGDKEGPPVLLVHGFGANVNHFRHQFPALVAAGYRVYAIDLLGFGASEKPLTAATTGFSIELFVQQLVDFLSAMSTTAQSAVKEDEKQQQQQHNGRRRQSWTLAGNSIGGLCCLGVAAQLERHPELRLRSNFDVSSIVLFNTSGGMTGFRYEDVPFWARPLLAFVQYVVLGPLCGGYFFRNFRTRANVERILKESGVYGDPTNVDEELLEILLAPADDPGAEQVFLAVFGGPAGPTAESVLPDVKVPVLALWGERDPWTPVDAGMHPGSALPAYHGTGEFYLSVLPGAGHCPHDECPDAVNAQMIAFLQEQQQSALLSTVTSASSQE